MAKHLFGWGGVRIYGSEFANAYGTLSFEPEYVRNKTVSGIYKQHFKGWRPVITTELFNYEDADLAKFLNLASGLSASMIANTATYIYPLYTSTELGSVLQYGCFLDSEFNLDSIAKVQIGQSIKLKWLGEYLVPELPTNYYGQVAVNFTDEDDENYVDELGNVYQLF